MYTLKRYGNRKIYLTMKRLAVSLAGTVKNAGQGAGLRRGNPERGLTVVRFVFISNLINTRSLLVSAAVLSVFHILTC